MSSPTGSPAFRQSLIDLLQAGPRRERALLARLERECGPRTPLYSTLLYLLTHLSFGERRAAAHWRRIAAHRERLRAQLSRDPGLRVAMLDYFANVRRELRSPKVIEIASYEHTERRAATDGLSGLFNHATFLQAVRHELLRSRRHGQKTALIILDLDDFKRLNDERGHLEGDRALVKVAAVVRESVREIDVAARYGGEEFAVLLPDTTRLGALVVAERVRRRIEERFARLRPPLTVSGGIAVFPDDAGSGSALLACADAALYAAKAAGKNRILSGRSSAPATLPLRRSPAHGHGALAAGPDRPAEMLVSLDQPVPLGSATTLRFESGGASLELCGRVVRVDSSPGPEPVCDVSVRLSIQKRGDVPEERGVVRSRD